MYKAMCLWSNFIASLYFALFGSLLAKTNMAPNIILIVADDLGYNDVGFHGSEIYTPNLDTLAKTGVSLENYYVPPLCSPSRAQLMTGRYSIHNGLGQNIHPLERLCLGLDEVTIAQKLRAQNYSTHMIGKWHLGHSNRECTPKHRGFDSFYGILLGCGDHYKHTMGQRIGNWSAAGYDFWRNDNISTLENGSYSTTLYRDEALKIISQHNPRYPLFMYLSFQAPHAPLQIPKEWLTRYSGVKDKKRKLYSAMVTALDSTVGDVVNSLKTNGLWENTVLVFTSDNGAQTMAGGSNLPYRGNKGELWEGGVRGVGLVNSLLIKKSGRKYHGLMHITDWFPTFVRLNRGKLKIPKTLDGLDQWDAINNNITSQRKEILLGMSPSYIKQSLKDQMTEINRVKAHSPREQRRYKTNKHISERFFSGKPRWYHLGAIRKMDWKLVVCMQRFANKSKALGFDIKHRSAIKQNNIRFHLFNLSKDPLEKVDLSRKWPKKVEELIKRLNIHYASATPAFSRKVENDMQGDPRLRGNFWTPWINAKLK